MRAWQIRLVGTVFLVAALGCWLLASGSPEAESQEDMNEQRSTDRDQPLQDELLQPSQQEFPTADAPATAFSIIDRLPATGDSAHYIGNRAPLAPSPAMKLPPGSIQPRGWLREQLQREASGMVGHLGEISKWLNFEQSAWANPNGRGMWEWEELPYWLKGYGDLGYVLGDEKIIAETQRWLEPVLASQQEDGYFGPPAIKTRLDGAPDLWPIMPMLNALQSYYEYTGDERVIELMTNFFRYELELPEEQFLLGFWGESRGGDNLESVYWLYNRTGDEWLLELADKLHRHTANWTGGFPNWHNVNIAQGFREPAQFWQQSQDDAHLAATHRNYDEVMRLYGQFPGGGFGGDENCRPGYDDPRQAFETCGIVEYMHSFEMLTKITGDPVWADRCEEIAFNSLPAATTPDFDGLHYLTAANQPQLDARSKQPSIQNAGTMFSYSPHEVYRCCQHNVAHGWPYFAEELWLATPNGGLCASMYAPSEVTATVGPGEGTQVTITQDTNYPFTENIEVSIAVVGEPVEFPLYFRIPGWCFSGRIIVAGKRFHFNEADLPPGASYICVDRRWSDGDQCFLRFDRDVVVRRWETNHDSVSVHYGPLAFSLSIDERWVRSGGTDAWPEYEVFPDSPWNYGLTLDGDNHIASLRVEDNHTLPAYPFTPWLTPLEIFVTGRRIPQWQLDQRDVAAPLQASPAFTTDPEVELRLVPMGCARLRISSFPVASENPTANHWQRRWELAASHCHYADTVDAVADEQLPESSHDESIPRLTFWDHKGTSEWVEMPFSELRTVSNSRVYWYADTPAGGCGVPASWRVLYLHDGQWLPVANATDYNTAQDQFNEVTFDPVETTALRLEIQLQPELSGGILEWEAE